MKGQGEKCSRVQKSSNAHSPSRAFDFSILVLILELCYIMVSFQNYLIDANVKMGCGGYIAVCLYRHQGRSQGGKGEIPPPPKPKNCCRKMVLFPKALFLVTNFQKKIKNKNKKIKNSIFLRTFIKKFQNFKKKNFPTICVFRPNAQKMNA